MRNFTVGCVFLLVAGVAQADYRISEIQGAEDDAGWIEVSGSGESIGGFKLIVADSAGKESEWAFPMETDGGERLLVFLAGKEAIIDGQMFAGLRLPKSGGSVRLMAPDASEPLSEVTLPDKWGEFSCGVNEEAGGKWGYLLGV